MSLFHGKKKWVPRAIQSMFTHIKKRWYVKQAVQNCVRTGSPIKLVIGSGGTSHPGWISTDVQVLNVTNASHWRRYFKPDSIDRVLAEHVLEHLTESQNRTALALCYMYLKPGGIFRVAVPDGYRRDHDYVTEVMPPKDGHQILFTIDTLTAMLKAAGFKVNSLEYFDSSEKFHAADWDNEDGHVRRSVRYDRQTAFQRGELYYTSLILDGIK